MTEHYKILFSCQVRHSFYADNVCRDVSFYPGKITKYLVKRYGFIYTVNNNGFSLSAVVDAPLSSFLDYIINVTGHKYLDFEMVVNDSSFNNFTELPVDWSGQFQFNSNETGGKTDSETTLNMILSDVTGSPRGVVHIYFADLMESIDNKIPIYVIQFVARATQWQYYVVSKSLIDADHKLSVYSKAGVPFCDPEEVIIATGERALLFASRTLLTLKEVPTYSFDLVAAREGEVSSQPTRIVYKGLPAPSKNKIGIVKDEDKTVVSSPMYVYV